MEKEICRIIEKDGVLSMNVDTNVNTALNALMLFVRTLYVSGVKNVGMDKEAFEEVLFNATKEAIAEGNEELP